MRPNQLENQLETITTMLSTGHSATKIAEQLNCSVSRICGIIKKYNLVNKYCHKYAIISESLLREELITNKLSINDLAKKLDVPNHAISSKISKYKLLPEIEKVRDKKDIDIKYGKLTIIKYHSTKSGHKKYECECECGKKVICFITSLRTGDTQSCGCITKQRMSNLNWSGYGEISKTYFSRIKHGAKIRNFQFSITIEEIWDLFIKQNRKCALSGQELYFVRNDSQQLGVKATASLDRIDNTKGYTLENVQWIHKDINLMKLDYNQEYYIHICELVSSYSKTKK